VVLPCKNRSIVGHLGLFYIFAEVVYSLEAFYLRYQYKYKKGSPLHGSDDGV